MTSIDHTNVNSSLTHNARNDRGIITPDPVNPNKVDAVYINSFGFKYGGYAAEDQAIVDTVRRIYTDAATSIKCTSEKFQNDGHSCGPNTVMILSKLAAAQNPAQEVDAIIEKYGKNPATLRQYHQDLMDGKSPDLDQMIAAATPTTTPKTTDTTKDTGAPVFTKVATVGAGAFLVKKALDFIWGKKPITKKPSNLNTKSIGWVCWVEACFY